MLTKTKWSWGTEGSALSAHPPTGKIAKRSLLIYVRGCGAQALSLHNRGDCFGRRSGSRSRSTLATAHKNERLREELLLRGLHAHAIVVRAWPFAAGKVGVVRT
jgi:hypothetical protein